jgi:hypothetical protein
LSAALGVVMVAMPISVISAKFNQIFIEQQTGNKVRRRRSDVKRCSVFFTPAKVHILTHICVCVFRKLTSKLRGMFC